MDWSKSKTIFIVVFLILNIFLYTQYVDLYNQGQNVEVLGERTIDAKLKDDNITYNSLPNNVESVSYYSGKMRNFNENKIDSYQHLDLEVVDNSILLATFHMPIPLKDMELEDAVKDFVSLYIQESDKYVLWEIDEEEKAATFFQKIDNRTLYYNSNGYLKIYWNEDKEVENYELTMFEKLEKLEQEESTIPPIQVLQALYNRSLLKPDARVIGMDLGYSTLVQLTQTQVFAPTWEVVVRNSDGVVERHYVNAVEGKVLEIQNSLLVEFDEEEN